MIQQVKMDTLDTVQVPLWDLHTLWFNCDNTNGVNSMNFPYKSWQDFMECRPYHMWKPYIMTSWCWKENYFQIVFVSPYLYNTASMYVEFPVTQKDEPAIRCWIKKHMPNFWKI